jgi:hypothetical protein
MSRARRLSEIAKANEPVFDSTGNQWWLADPSAKKEQQTSSQPDSPAVPEPEPVAVAASAVAMQIGNPHISSANGAVPPAPAAVQTVCVQAKAEENLDPISRDLPSRLSGFKERFLWLGRKHRGE